MTITKELTIPARKVENFGTTDERLRHDKGGCWELALIGGYHRDSETLDLANAEEIDARLAMVDPERTAWDRIEANHWAVGWTNHLIVDPSHELVMATLQQAAQKLEGYPILNEDRLSEMEVQAHDDELCDQHCPLCDEE